MTAAEEAKENFRMRLKDLLWSFRQRYITTSITGAIDRFLPYIALSLDLTYEQLLEKFVAYKKILPEDFCAITLDYLQNTVKVYWSFCKQPTENIASTLERRLKFGYSLLRGGAPAFDIVPDIARGWRLGEKK
jgi:hypothetical protein